MFVHTYMYEWYDGIVWHAFQSNDIVSFDAHSINDGCLPHLLLLLHVLFRSPLFSYHACVCWLSSSSLFTVFSVVHRRCRFSFKQYFARFNKCGIFWLILKYECLLPNNERQKSRAILSLVNFLQWNFSARTASNRNGTERKLWLDIHIYRDIYTISDVRTIQDTERSWTKEWKYGIHLIVINREANDGDDITDEFNAKSFVVLVNLWRQ